MLRRVPTLLWHSRRTIEEIFVPVPLFTQHPRPSSFTARRESLYYPERFKVTAQPRPLLSQALHTSLITMSSYPFCADYDKRGTAKCKTCKEKCEKGFLRLGKVVSNPFSSGDTMKQWYHTKCLFESFKRARATTKKIDDPQEDIENWDQVEDDDRKEITALVDELQETLAQKAAATPKKQTPKKKAAAAAAAAAAATSPQPTTSAANHRPDPKTDRNHKDNSFREFRRLCAAVADEPSYLSKTHLVSTFLKDGSGKDGFKGDLRLWVKLLLPGVIKRVYNLQSKQLLKLFSQVFSTNIEEMLEDLEQGDVAETVRKFFEESRQLPPVKKSHLSIQDVNDFLKDLSGKTKEEDQAITLRTIAKRSTANDLKMVVRLIKGDLRINAGAKHILEAVHSDAYEAFQTTRDIDSVMDKILAGEGDSLKMSARVMTPVLPMLAEACKSVEYAFKKCPSGVMYAEVKYDGERVQLHKNGSDFRYFSRSLKPVMPHKVEHFKQYIPQAFPKANDLILDAEVLMLCMKTGNPLPFGTLGVHKKAQFQDACPCLFVFDCLHYNGEDLMNKPIADRRRILEKTMVEVKNRVLFSELVKIERPEDLKDMIARVLKQGLEGLVLKDLQSIYEPGKRHWLKVKKDYLNDGAMADTADLVVLGAWYGTGKKGGMMSVFLMGCFDPCINKWCTVTKVHTGHDDAALERLQDELDMTKISQDATRVPAWLKVNKTLIPDFVATDPKKSPVWEITGAEFTRHKVHTADGISIRFPRVTKERTDKNWETATDLNLLQSLYTASKESVQLDGFMDEGEEGERCSTPASTNSSTASNSSSPTKTPGTPTNLKGKKRPATEGTDDARGTGRNEERKKKKKMGVEDDGADKKVCARGARCTLDNDAHRLLYQHPPGTFHAAVATPTTTTTITTTAPMKPPSSTMKPPTSNPLPDIFTGVFVTVPGDLKDRKLMLRYVVAYGGEVLPDHRAQEATHVIVPDGAESGAEGDVASKAVRVRPEWVWSSVKAQRRLHTTHFKA